MFWEKTLSFVHLTSVYFSAVISVITTVIRRTISSSDWPRWYILLPFHFRGLWRWCSSLCTGADTSEAIPLPPPRHSTTTESKKSQLVGGLRGFIFESRLGWISLPNKEPPETLNKRSAEAAAHCCQETWEERSQFLSNKCQSRIIWEDRSSSQLKADTEITITRNDISHLLFLFFKKGWVFWLLFPCI